MTARLLWTRCFSAIRGEAKIRRNLRNGKPLSADRDYPTPMNDAFEALGLCAELVAELNSLGYEEPTPIQSAAIPPFLAGKDLLGQAATGTGKTAAFALPLIHRVASTKPAPHKPLVLVLVPTRELAVQVSEAFHRYGRSLRLSVAPIYGGQDFYRQTVALKRGTHVVIATPGRVLDHMRRGTIDFSDIQSVVLDEADEMLDMGFAEDLELILEALPEVRQTALFSATLPPRISGIAERHLKNPTRVLIPRDTSTKGSIPKVRQTAYVVPRAHKVTALGRILDLESPTLALIFCRTRIEVDELAERMVGRGYRVEAMHGGMTQNIRDRVIKKARAAALDLLIATDVAARGLDIEHISHVVNFDVPSSPESYVHRIGRTGRAGREGVAITLVESREYRLMRNIESVTRTKIEKATVPSPMDVKARRLDLTKGALRETIAEGDLDSYRAVVEALGGEFDLMDVAAAAVRLAHEASQGSSGNEDDVNIPDYQSAARPQRTQYGENRGGYEQRSGSEQRGGYESRPGTDRPQHHAFPSAGPQAAKFTPRVEVKPVAKDAPRAEVKPVAKVAPPAPLPPSIEKKQKSLGWDAGKKPVAQAVAPARNASPASMANKPVNDDRDAPRGSNANDLVRVYIGAGKKLGVRPADLVGAIANEAQVNARGIGDIEIADGFSIVELPARDAEKVVTALRGATLRGKKVTVRIDDGRHHG